MKVDELSVADSWVCSPQAHADPRGTFLEWFRADVLHDVTGRRFEIAQANHSISRRGVVRGIHCAAVPPGQSKVVYCPSGAVLDVVVDLRVGSPTFGAVDSVVLDAVERRVVVVSEGLGHAFCALRDDSSVAYLVSTVYQPGAEFSVSPLDPDLALPWPVDLGELELSEKDRSAPGLAEAQDAGVLPTYAACLERYAALRGQ